jgi:hypothetical protein
MRSKVEFEFLEFARRKRPPGPEKPFSEPEAVKNHARRATDQRAILPMVGIRNGLIAGACIWLAILTILAGMAS